MPPKTVLTLDAGGTNFVFAAIRDFKQVAGPVRLPSEGHDLKGSLNNIISGFETLIQETGTPDAISFAFPGPTDYPNGIIGDLYNLSGYRGGVALKAMLEAKFKVPVFINNDGNLYCYGEAIAGFLPEINQELLNAGSVKQYQNLIGITLGTGFGGGITLNGNLLIGDNSNGGEVWLLRNFVHPETNAEESISIRAVLREYFNLTGTTPGSELTPKDIYEIALEKKDGNKEAALKSFQMLGISLGEALANVITIIDGLVVIGGGIGGARDLILPALINHLNGEIKDVNGNSKPRLVQKVYNLDNREEMKAFLKDQSREILVPGSNSILKYDAVPRTGVGFSRIGTSEAIAYGAYAFACNSISGK